MLSSVLSQSGKFGAYGSPFDVKVKNLSTNDNVVTFTTLTPGLRESERQVMIKTIQVFPKNFVVLITGSTKQSFSEAVFQNVIDSFDAVAAPSRY